MAGCASGNTCWISSTRRFALCALGRRARFYHATCTCATILSKACTAFLPKCRRRASATAARRTRPRCCARPAVAHHGACAARPHLLKVLRPQMLFVITGVTKTIGNQQMAYLGSDMGWVFLNAALSSIGPYATPMHASFHRSSRVLRAQGVHSHIRARHRKLVPDEARVPHGLHCGIARRRRHGVFRAGHEVCRLRSHVGHLRVASRVHCRCVAGFVCAVCAFHL